MDFFGKLSQGHRKMSLYVFSRRQKSMTDYTHILFDLDGTLTDSGPGIMNSVMYALERFGVTVDDRATLRKFIGPPLIDSFREFCGFSDDEAQRALVLYRAYFSEKGLFENAVYPGIPALLQRLRDAGRTLLVATGKPEEFSLRILEHFGLLQYFDFVSGASMDESRNQKWQVIERALAHCGATERSQCLMVGDRKHDVQGARRCGLPCLGVLYGYGSAEELVSAGADALAGSPAAVGDYILPG